MCDIIWTVSPRLIMSEVLLRLLTTAVLTITNSCALPSLASGVQGTACFVAILWLQDWSHNCLHFVSLSPCRLAAQLSKSALFFLVHVPGINYCNGINCPIGKSLFVTLPCWDQLHQSCQLKSVIDECH